MIALNRLLPFFVERQAHALILDNNVLLNGNRKIAGLAERHGLPAMYFGSYLVRAGGLMSYSMTNNANYHLAANQYVARILKGEKPADLPVQQPTKFEFVVNMKTAKTLGLQVPPMLLAIADEVIE
jgi:putative ABC transport system substrate-binding protein